MLPQSMDNNSNSGGGTNNVTGPTSITGPTTPLSSILQVQSLSATALNQQQQQQQQSIALGQTSVSVMDDLVKEYLLFRGFGSTLKSFEYELKSEKTSTSFRADKCTDLILAYVHAYDLTLLLDFWSYLENKFFSRLTIKSSGSGGSSLPGFTVSRKYELFILRYYMIHAMQTSRQDKAIELLEHCANKMQAQPEWRDWYMLPFLKTPEENPIFAVYFSRNWIDTFIMSLQNFLNVVFQSLPFPRLLNYDEDAFWNKQQQRSQSSNQSFTSLEHEYLRNELVDEFKLIQSDQQSRQGNTLINMIKNLTTTSKAKGQSTSSQKSIIFSQQVNSPSTNQVPSNASNAKTLGGPNDSWRCQQAMTPATKKVNKRNLEKIPDEPTQPDEDEKISKPTTTSDQVSFSLSLSVTSQSELQPLPDFRLEEPKLIEQAMSSIKTVEHYLNMSHEDYLQHKSPILQCKFSNDGKYVASADSQGYIKIWSVENPVNTINTLVQKSSVLSIEWDYRNYNLLYIGTRSFCVKVYDVQQKKTVQELSLNKGFPLVTLVRSFSYTPKILIFTASKPLSRKDGSQFRNSQVIVSEQRNNGSLSIEKSIDLESYYCQSCVGIEPEMAVTQTVIFGCSDGFIRVFSLSTASITFAENLHPSSVLNLIVRKNFSLISLSTECVQLSRLIMESGNVQLEPINTIHITKNCIERLNINAPFHSLESLISSGTNNTSFVQQSSADSNADLKFMLNSSRLLAVDATDQAVFVLDKSGVYVADLAGSFEETRSSSPRATGAQLFGLANATTFDLWNSNHLSILLIGSMNGTVRFFRLLHQF